MRTQLRIVAGSLRGRRLHCTVNPHLRPMPDMVRQALFSILGDAVPGQPFYDLFAGTGAVGLEAVSRGAQPVVLVERDPRTANEIARHLREFDIADRAEVHRADVYRWVEHWQAPGEPVNIFLGPPFPHYDRRLESLIQALADLQWKAAPGSVLVLQGDRTAPRVEELPDAEHWEERNYGRNRLLIWVKESPPTQSEPEA
jgi:16S rRNA (guanine(966)-N(2))-methyltransferase RsmD